MSNSRFSALDKITGGRGFIVIVEVVYLLIILVVGFLYATDVRHLLPFTLPDTFGTLPAGVPWFGALGAVMISLSAIFDHVNDWDTRRKYWHYCRPLVGAALAIISVLTFQSGMLAVSHASVPTSPTAVTDPSNILYYVIAFIVGYREETFRELIKRAADVFLKPGDVTKSGAASQDNSANGTQVADNGIANLRSKVTDASGDELTPAAITTQVGVASRTTLSAPPSKENI